MSLDRFIPRKISREELNSLVDRAADLIRTAVDYKFILVLLFLKRLNDVWKSEKEKLKERIMKEVGLPERLATAISELAKRNKELQGVIDRVDFLEFARSQGNRELLRQLVELFNRYNLSNEYASPDVLGDAYEHILMRFAPTRAKEGEIYTPREVIRLLVEILDPKPGESVYDPCHGSGGMLIISYLYVAEKYGEEGARRLFLYGQERSPTIYAISWMNLLLHDIGNANLAREDTLDHPMFREGGKLKQFDVVMANVPWNQDGYGEDRLKKADLSERFRFGYPPKNTADWAWIQHMLGSAKENGRVGLVIDNGCLFRGGREKIIRMKIVMRDWIECIILLPEKLFYNTGAPGAIIIFNKNKPPERKGKILFINASNEYIPHPSVRRLNSLSRENIRKIVDAYRKFTDISGFSRVVEISEVRDNDYNLNVTIYVMPIEEEEPIDIAKEFSELKKLEVERQQVEKELEEYISQLTQVLGNEL